MDKDKKRGQRRDRTRRYGRSAQRVHVRFTHTSGPVDCLCERSVWFFAKK